VLPPRPTPAPPSSATGVPGEGKPTGGWIQLRAQAPATVWSIVEWQNDQGAWVPVEGWRGAFDSYADGVGQKKWWVDQYTFGPTPFRWVLYDPATGAVISTSTPFASPKENRQTVNATAGMTP
jgi:hypothetical protein